MRAHKAEKYQEIKQRGNKNEFEEWFLNYKPDDLKGKKENPDKSKDKSVVKKKRKPKTKKSKLLAIYGGKTRRNKY
jgi:phosphoketolase